MWGVNFLEPRRGFESFFRLKGKVLNIFFMPQWQTNLNKCHRRAVVVKKNPIEFPYIKYMPKGSLFYFTHFRGQ